MTATVIVNPRSAHGRTRRRWARLERELAAVLGPLDVHHTQGPMHAAELARSALEAGSRTVIAVGGDGTLSETINGFFVDGRPINPEASLGILMQGTGGDFRRSHDIPLDSGAQLEVLRQQSTRIIDVVQLDYVDFDGRPAQRYYGNIASMGMSGQVCAAVNRARLSKLLGGKAAFNIASLQAASRFNNQRVCLRFDDGQAETLCANTVAVANGRFFGGGMMVAPHADPADGMLDVVTIGDFARREMFRSMRHLYRGTHLDHPKVQHRLASRVEARADDGEGPVLLEVDGEGPGRLPATFQIIPGALRIIAPARQVGP